MRLPPHKTKIVCTIGPASNSPAVMEQMLKAGMNVARLNFSHGDFAGHRSVIDSLRAAERATGRRLTIMADLPGPKMRIGHLKQEPIHLKAGGDFTLTAGNTDGDEAGVSTNFDRLAERVKPGDALFLNDGLIHLEVRRTVGKDVHCCVIVGGELRSKKGLNLPDIDLGISAFTEHDYECLKFALENGVDAISQSFVESAADVEAVREAAASLGCHPFIVAKVERSRALKAIEEIVRAADGIMIARGDLGVELPIEQIAAVQKQVVRLSNRMAKPVITATQMLESMISNRRPTRAEATDVANAILDGTDCVMLSGESAIGNYPVDAVAMLSRIATATESYLSPISAKEMFAGIDLRDKVPTERLIDLAVETVLEYAPRAFVFARTHSGKTARSIARFRLPTWIIAVSSNEASCRHLQFSFGVQAIHEAEPPKDWRAYSQGWLRAHGLEANLVVLTQGRTTSESEANYTMEILKLNGK